MDFEGVLRDGTFRIGVVLGSAHEHYLKNSTIPVLKQIYQKMVLPDELPKGYTEGVHRVCSENKYGFVMPFMMFLGLVREAPCQMTNIPKAYYSISMSMIVNKKNPYKRIFRHYVQEIRRSGILMRNKAADLQPIPKELLPNPPASVAYDTVHVFIYILLIGIAVAAVLCAAEISYVKYWRNRHKFTCAPRRKSRLSLCTHLLTQRHRKQQNRQRN
ncbi:uncharacterized protein [Periplaneta americana]|uniref:uncharacterized protein n=1 Tax=Periplaneta americana TaxID=6978 RepID=UPI0037E99B41